MASSPNVSQLASCEVLKTTCADPSAGRPGDPSRKRGPQNAAAGVPRAIEDGREGDTALILEPTTAVLVGRPDQELLCGGWRENPPRPTLLVQAEALRTVCEALPGWTSRAFIVQALPPVPQDIPRVRGVIVSAPLDPAVLTRLPDYMRRDTADSAAVAVRLVDGYRFRGALCPT